VRIVTTQPPGPTGADPDTAADQQDHPAGRYGGMSAGAALVAPDQVEAVEHDRRTVLASGALGVLMVVLAVVVLVDAASLPETDDAVGPADVPNLVGALLAVTGLTLVVRAALDLRTAVSGAALPRGRLLRLAAMLALLFAFALLLPVLGYVVTSTALFTGAALLLGAVDPWRTLAYGWTLAVVVFLIFDRLIGLTLPTGPWGF
jgi:putative tricarboxylic transport membrane protein